MNSRIIRLREKMKTESLDAFLITSFENYRYFSGFSGSNCALIITKNQAFAFTDGRYTVQIKNQAKGFESIIIERTMPEHIAELLDNIEASSVGYETHNVTDFFISKIKALASSSEFVPCPDFGKEIRMVKDESEIALMRRAAEISDNSFLALCTKITKGMTEREAAATLEYEMAKRKSTAPAFNTIAASEIRGSMPHAEAEDIEIPDNCLMTFDFGATVDGYKSDITRTIHIGKPQKDLEDLFDIVFEVQQKCLSEVRSGKEARALDALAHALFAEHGVDKYFTHALGHGVGLAIHEEPTLSRRSGTVLEKGMIVTIEPGLYVEGLGGVRIEDSVVVTDGGCEVLTHAPHRINISL